MFLLRRCHAVNTTPATDVPHQLLGCDGEVCEVTVGINVGYEAREEPVDPLKALVGSPEEIAAGLKGYADAGVGHVIAALRPNNADGLARFAETVKIFRQMTD